MSASLFRKASEPTTKPNFVASLGLTLRFLRPTPDAARRSSWNRASRSSMLKSQSLVNILAFGSPSVERIFSMRRLCAEKHKVVFNSSLKGKPKGPQYT